VPFVPLKALATCMDQQPLSASKYTLDWFSAW
jgi:hypothetical protein